MSTTRIVQEERPKIQRIEHTDFGSGRPYFDDELKMSQSIEHEIAINYLSYCFKYIAKNLQMTCLSDHPVWYLLTKPKNGKIQKALYPDLCISKELDHTRVTAEDLLFCLEVVSTERRRKEVKDTIIMKGRNEYNKVAEFVLIFPKSSDNRVIEYYHFNGSHYIPILQQEGEYFSRVLKGLSFREIPRDDWKNGEKVEVLFNGKILIRYDELWDNLEEEQKRVVREQKRAEKERSEKELLAKKLRELGFDPNEIMSKKKF